MNWNFQYGELANDIEFVTKYENLKDGLMEIGQVIEKLEVYRAHYDEMSLPARIELDLFHAYTLNSLHWINMRILGIDPSETPVKDELDRVKAAMLKWKEFQDRDQRPSVNIDAAKRFIRSGLYDSLQASRQPLRKTKNPQDNNLESQEQNIEPPNKKIKFEDDD